MKIKKKEYNRLTSEITQLRKIADTQFKLMAVDSTGIGNEIPIILTTLEHMYVSAYYGEYSNDVNDPPIEYMTGTFRIIVTPPDRASGFDYFLAHKYTGENDSPWETLQNVQLRPDTNASHWLRIAADALRLPTQNKLVVSQDTDASDAEESP